MVLDGRFFKTVVPEVVFVGAAEPTFADVVIDSRRVSEGSTFVALKGAAVDGHEFVAQAVAEGASSLIIAAHRRSCLDVFTPKQLAKLSIALVDDPEKALYRLASAWRQQFSYPIVGVTGSLGKTSAKEMIAAMVRHAGKECVVSEGNYNTLLGISMTLLKMRPEHHCAVIEMGISCGGEMAKLADLARPTMGVITTIAHQHMDGLGSLADIAAEKRDIFKYFKEDNIGIVNGDQAILSSIAYAHPVAKFGYKTTNQVQARRIVMNGMKMSCVIKLFGKRYQVMMPTPHKGRLLNALAGATAAYFLGIPEESIIAAMQQADAVPGRFQVLPLKTGTGVVINDCYNANPESMREALSAFERFEARGTKVAVLGDMLGLGANSVFWHRQLGRSLRKTPSIERVIFVGEQVKAAEKTIPRGISFEIVADWQAAIAALKPHLGSDLVVLVKASNGMGLQKLVDELA